MKLLAQLAWIAVPVALTFASLPAGAAAGNGCVVKAQEALRAEADQHRVIPPAGVAERIAWIQQRPSKQLVIRESGPMYSIDRTGMPSGAQIIELAEDQGFFHLTSRKAANLIIREQLLLAGSSPYTHAMSAGTEMIYTNYVDLTGVFLLDRLPGKGETGFTGARAMDVALKVTLPRGLRILKLESAIEPLPFYLIPLRSGDGVRPRVEALP